MTRRATPRPVTIRSATMRDLVAMAGIYNEAVATSTATFDLVAQPPEVFAERVASSRQGDHTLVAEDAARVIGMAYAVPYRPRPAYDLTRETSVYLAPGARGAGVGTALYGELLRRVDADGIHTCLAAIAQPNPASEALHTASGFERVGALREVGRKFDRWIDIAWWQRLRQ